MLFICGPTVDTDRLGIACPLLRLLAAIVAGLAERPEVGGIPEKAEITAMRGFVVRYKLRCPAFEPAALLASEMVTDED